MHDTTAYTVADLILNTSDSDNQQRCQMIKDILRCMKFDEQKIERIRRVFLSEMELALHEEPSSPQMENTYIPELPDGTEEGEYLALDRGGTNFRVMVLGIQKHEIV